MKNEFTTEVLLVSGIIAALFLALNPWHWFMSDMFVMTLMCVASILFFLFVSFVFRERVQDEREELHRYISARLGYLGGAGVLMIIIVVQEFQHTDNDALMYALGAMLLMKVAGSIYAKKRY